MTLSGKLFRVVIWMLIVLVWSCLEPFEASVSASNLDLLVVEGYINAGPGSTQINLSRVTPLSNSDFLPQKNASVSVENNEGDSFTLTETDHGKYIGELNLPTTMQYRLHITLPNGKEYRSDFSSVKITPPIDSVNWEWDSEGLHIYAITHDDESKTHYYKWDYEEDWQIRAPFDALYIWEDDTVKKRPIAEQVLMLNCWNSSRTQKFIFNSTRSLAKDSIKQRLLTLPHNSSKTSVRYSVLVKQHTIDEREFNYLEIIKKNTTQTGSFSDPLPYQLFGNIKSVTHPDETVIGCIGSYTTEKRRLFILYSELPPVPPGDNCLSRQAGVAPFFKIDDVDSINKYLNPNLYYVPYQTWLDAEKNTWVQFIQIPCVDCRVFGTPAKPDFW